LPRKVLVTDSVFSGVGVEREVLAPLGVEIVVASDQRSETLAVEAADAIGLLVCFAQVTRPVVHAAASGGCKVIARYGIGYDNVDLQAATEAGIVVTNVPDYCLDEVADHTMALVLALARRVVAAARNVASGGWKIDDASIRRLRGRRLALIGLGGIGRRVARRAQAFGFEVVGHDPQVDASRIPGILPAPSFEEAVRDADVVSLHVPMSEENARLIRAETLGLMQGRPILVNTARGGLVDLDDLLAALDEGRLSGAALDVTEPEPLPAAHPLRDHPRAIVTPHMAFHSAEATEEVRRRAAGEVARTLRGYPPDCPVNEVALS
jgi:D-3-phosphoglycerate dehydrogenase / 2-oxoglutarate reductase